MEEFISRLKQADIRIVGTNKKHHNKVGKALQVIAWLILIAGIIAGFSLAITQEKNYWGYGYHTEIDWTVCLLWWAGSVTGWLLLLGLAEIISLLQQLVDCSDYKMTLSIPPKPVVYNDTEAANKTGDAPVRTEPAVNG